jgi:ectoine hydroxylase-related dioxygenase (phytanoyl-CoA dioxygenase family)
MPGTLTAENCRLDDLRAVLEQPTVAADYPHATEIVDGVLVYPAAVLADTPPTELAAALADGPGIVIVRDAFTPETVHRASRAFGELIAEQHASGAQGGDHFARPGTNDRIWNALGKLGAKDPETFVEYYANETLALVSAAWLGPGYQVTSQVNVVNPGGAAQVGHRDYHLGFLTPGQIEQYPEHVHRLSPVLTLQGAVAHSDMPVETGPTCYLPHSQKYPAGYLATVRPEFRAYFDEHHVQLPLRLGDAVFFNPAVIHGAGTNRTRDVKRTLALAAHDPEGAEYALACAAEGYPFPTNLDSDPPLDGLAPPSQADLVRRALAERWSADALATELAAQSARRSTR